MRSWAPTLPTLKNERKCLDKVDYKFNYPSGSALPKINAPRKMHKLTDSDSFPELRSIVFPIGAYNYNLAKYLCNLQSPHLFDQCCTKDTFKFIEKHKRVSLVDKFLVFFDVTILFINNALTEACQNIVNRLKHV